MYLQGNKLRNVPKLKARNLGIIDLAGNEISDVWEFFTATYERL